MEEKLRKTLVRQGKMKIIYWMQHFTFRIRWLIDRVGGGVGGVGAEDRREKKKGKEAVGGGHGGVTHATLMQPFCFGRSSSFVCVSIQNYFCLFRCWCGRVHRCLRLRSDQIQHYVYVRSQASLNFYQVSNPIAAAPKRTEKNKTKKPCKTCIFDRTVEINASRGHTPEKGASMCDRLGCDFWQHVGIDTSAASVWQALVITLLLHLITILRKAASVRTRTGLI